MPAPMNNFKSVERLIYLFNLYEGNLLKDVLALLDENIRVKSKAKMALF